MAPGPTFCAAGVFTRVYDSFAGIGYIWVGMTGPNQTVTYDVYESAIPFYFRNTLTFYGGPDGTLLKIGPLAVSAQLWVNPTLACGMSALSL